MKEAYSETAQSRTERTKEPASRTSYTPPSKTPTGLGKIKVDKLDFDQGTANVSITNCFEALENGPAEGPNCMFTSGFLAGLFAEVFDKTVQANEVRCISQGSTECEFQIILAEETLTPDGTLGDEAATAASLQAPTSGTAGTTPEPTSGPKTDLDSKPVVVEPGSKDKGETQGKPAQDKWAQADLDVGVERAARIAKKKQGFWDRLFKK